MIRGDRDLDSICAVSTPLGTGGISVLRLSGSISSSVMAKIAPFLPPSPESHRVYYGKLHSCFPENLGDVLDEVMITYFQKGRSFTGEKTFEISCHGSPTITKRILKELVFAGARIADRGEFTYRAFMNGRLDLVQAESVLSLIQAQSDLSTKQALRQLSGHLSKTLEDIESDLIWCLAHIEAGIDFSSEDIEVVTNQELEIRFLSVKARLKKLIESYEKGRLIRDGLRVVLVGEPNVGKSSLLNILVEEDRAIVTDVPGTTRDTIEAGFLVDGVKVIATDTAGLRDTDDKIEKIGIERSYKALSEADRIFFVFDSSKPLGSRELLEIEGLQLEKLYVLGNKVDLSTESPENLKKLIFRQLKTLENFQNRPDFELFMEARVQFLSAWDKSASEELKSLLSRDLATSGLEDQALISQARHFENLSKALENMERSFLLLRQNLSGEFLALEMKEALLCIQETLGKRYDDQIMDRVFKEFCIGK